MQQHRTKIRREIATGGNPVRAVTDELARWRAERGDGVYRLTVAHDNGCPSTQGRPLTECTCEIVHLTGARVR